MPEQVLVGILIGSESDRERMQPCLDELENRGIPCELEVRSAHRSPDAVAEYGGNDRVLQYAAPLSPHLAASLVYGQAEYARGAAGRGIKVLICGAGMAAALPGMVAAYTELPVIGVPLRSEKSAMDGMDALLAMAQMPPGVPVATVSIDGAKNAAILAARILALS